MKNYAIEERQSSEAYKKELLQELYEYYNYFDNVNKDNAEIEKLNKNFGSINVKLNELESEKSLARFKSWLAIVILNIILVELLGEGIIFVFGRFMGGTFKLIISFICTGYLVFIAAVYARKRSAVKATAVNDKNKIEIDRLNLEKNRIISEINDIVKIRNYRYDEYSTVTGKTPILAREFSNTQSINRIYTYIQQGRADTIKEAINLMINDDKLAAIKSEYDSEISRLQNEINNLSYENDQTERKARWAYMASISNRDRR